MHAPSVAPVTPVRSGSAAGARAGGLRALAAAGTALVAAGGVVVALGMHPVAVGAVPAPVPPATTAAAAPAVAGAVPVAVALPERGITAPVVPVGTEADGALVIPDPPSTVGWWRPSALVGGSGGTTVIAGHIDSRVAGVGAFAVLPELRPGELVRIRGADGRIVGYRVDGTREYVKARLPVDELFTIGGPPRLVLISCSGPFNRATRSYANNVVVYASPVVGRELSTLGG